MHRNTGISDLYFIFADNMYSKYIDITKMKALINFYALLYERIIIPDSFLINNKYLREFLLKEEGYKYFENGIIVPSVRSSANGLMEVYEEFKQNRTFVGFEENEERYILDFFLKLDECECVEWNKDTIGSTFVENIFGNIDAVEVDRNDKYVWLEELDKRRKIDGEYLKRLNIRQLNDSIIFNDEKTKIKLNGYIDVLYNFNIPNALGMSAAYPQELMNMSSGMSPEKIYFKKEYSDMSLDIVRDESIETSILDIGVLSSLNFEQIREIRRLSSFKKFVGAIENIERNGYEYNLRQRFIDYIEDFDDILVQVVDMENWKYIQKNKKKIKVLDMGIDTVSGDVVGMAVSVLADGIMELTGAKLIGKLVNVAMRPIKVKTDRRIRHLERDGKRKVNSVKSNEHINALIKSFGLNSIG